MGNWRRPLIKLVHKYIKGSYVHEYAAMLRAFSALSVEEQQHVQQERVIELLKHAALPGPYYRDALTKTGVCANGNIDLSQFSCLPFLTKETPRSKLEQLKSDDLSSCRWYENMSGGPPNVILEYMRLGLPVVARNVGGVGEAVVDGQTGWLAPAGRPDILGNDVCRPPRNTAVRLEAGCLGQRWARQLFSNWRMLGVHRSLPQAAMWSPGVENRLGEMRCGVNDEHRLHTEVSVCCRRMPLRGQ
jgi:glycosyltransferase involved in cell wall biosynthesis